MSSQPNVMGGALRRIPGATTIQSFVRTPEDRRRFVAFTEEILRERLLLKDILARPHLRERLLEYHFEQVGYVGAPDHVMGERVVLLRIDGELFAVRLAARGDAHGVEPIVTVDGIQDGTVMQVLDRHDFLTLWSRGTGLPREGYNTVSSTQPYIRALVSGEPMRLHGIRLLMESVLGQGLEGTVFLVREPDTGERFALKTSHKDFLKLFEYWSDGFAIIRRTAPHILPFLCEFYSYEAKGEHGSTLLMQYRPVISLNDRLSDLTPRDRLRQGLAALADSVRVVRTLWGLSLHHGDVGVSNTYLYPTAGGPHHTVLLDPHPAALEVENTEAHYRKDLFNLVHMLYWLVTASQWPAGTFEYIQRVMRNEYDPEEGRRIFAAPPLSADPEYELLHAEAIKALGGAREAYDHVLDLIIERASR